MGSKGSKTLPVRESNTAISEISYLDLEEQRQQRTGCCCFISDEDPFDLLQYERWQEAVRRMLRQRYRHYGWARFVVQRFTVEVQEGADMMRMLIEDVQMQRSTTVFMSQLGQDFNIQFRVMDESGHEAPEKVERTLTRKVTKN